MTQGVWVVHPGTHTWVTSGTITAKPGDSFSIGETKPTASNTGYATGTTFTTLSGTVTYASNNQLIENTKFTGMVKVTGQNITFRNCWFAATGSAIACLWIPGETPQNIVCERCTFRPAIAATIDDSVGACVFGHDFTLVRCNLSGATDAVDIYRTSTGGALNVKILGCWLHDLAYWSPDSSHDDNQSHSDLIQIHYGGTDIHLFGNRFDGTIDPALGNANEPSIDNGEDHISGNSLYPAMVSMSVIMASPVSTTAGLTNFIFEKNWADGGVCMINWPRTDGVNIQIINNRWGHTTYLGDTYTVLAKAGQAMTITGNYYEDTGTAYNGRKNG